MTRQMQNAINKAGRIKMSVRYLGGRAYLVVTPARHAYTVRFEMHNGLRYGRCNCKAGASGVPCYHLPKAAMVDTAVQSMRAN